MVMTAGETPFSSTGQVEEGLLGELNQALFTSVHMLSPFL